MIHGMSTHPRIVADARVSGRGPLGAGADAVPATGRLRQGSYINNSNNEYIGAHGISSSIRQMCCCAGARRARPGRE